MLINEAFQRQLSTIVEVLVAAAVAEMGRLLDECSAAVMPLKLVQQNEESILLKSRLQRVNKTKTVTAHLVGCWDYEFAVECRQTWLTS